MSPIRQNNVASAWGVVVGTRHKVKWWSWYPGTKTENKAVWVPSNVLTTRRCGYPAMFRHSTEKGLGSSGGLGPMGTKAEKETVAAPRYLGGAKVPGYEAGPGHYKPTGSPFTVTRPTPVLALLLPFLHLSLVFSELPGLDIWEIQCETWDMRLARLPDNKRSCL